MYVSDREEHEVALALHLIRENKMNLLDAVKEQVEVEKRRQKMAEVSSAVELFLNDKQDMGNAETTMKTLRSIVLRFACQFDGRMMGEVTHQEIKEWIKSLGVATRTKNGYLKEVKSLYNWAIKEGYSEENPTRRIDRYRHTVEELEAKESAKEILTTGEVETMTQYVMRNCPDAMPRMAIQLYAGTRPERESASIEMSNVLMDDGLIHVPASKAKDRKERLIKMSDKLWGVMKWAKGNDIPLQPRDWDRKWSAIKDSVGLLGCWPNSCTRHTFASYNLSKFGAERTRESLGHGNYDMLFQHYRTLVHPSEAEKYFAA